MENSAAPDFGGGTFGGGQNFGPEDPGSGLGMAGAFGPAGLPDAGLGGGLGATPGVSPAASAGFSSGKPGESNMAQAESQIDFSGGVPPDAGGATFMEALVAALKSTGGKAARSTVAAMNPLAMLANIAFNIMTADDKVSATLGSIPGPLGFGLSTAYGMAKSDDPGRTFADRTIGMLGAQLGGRVAGPAGAQVGASLAGNALNAARSAGPGAGTLGALSDLGNYPGNRDDNWWNSVLTNSFGPPNPSL